MNGGIATRNATPAEWVAEPFAVEKLSSSFVQTMPPGLS
jgi:hypothetical protein